MIQVATPLGFITTTVTASAVAFSAIVVSATTTFIVPSGANLVLLVAQSSPINWRDDGVAPTPSSGIQMQVTVAPFEYAGNLHGIQFASASTTAVLAAAFYKFVGS